MTGAYTMDRRTLRQTILQAAILLISVLSTAPGQDGWKAIYQQGRQVQPHDMVALRGGGFLAVGENGAIFQHGDPASCWSLEFLPTGGRDLRTIAMRDDVNGYAAGEDGLWMRTTDKGKHWSELHPFTKHSILKMHFWSGDSGIALSVPGEIWLTRDGGDSWVLRHTADVDSLFDAVHLPGKRLVVAGHQGRVFRSSDDGETWFQHYSFPKDSYYCLAVNTDTTRIAMAGLGGSLWYSTDFGFTWQSNIWTHSTAVKDAWFTDAQTMRVLMEWRLYNIRFNPFSQAETFGFIKKGVGAECGGIIQLLGADGVSSSLSEGSEFWSSPVWVSWESRSTALPDGSICCWTDGDSPAKIRLATDGLQSIIRIKYQTFVQLPDRDQYGKRRQSCFAAYDRNTALLIERLYGTEYIYYALPGWRSFIKFAERTVGASGGTTALAFISEKEILGCCNGNVQRSTDGGATWTAAFAAAGSMQCISFSQDRRTGAVAGSGGYVYVTNDWGKHWEEYKAPSGATFKDVEVHENCVVAIGSGGSVFVSQTYGETWNEYRLPVTGELRGITIASSHAIFVCADSGLVFSTGVGRGEWLREELPTTSDCQAIEVLPDGTLLVKTAVGPYFRMIEDDLLSVERPAPAHFPAKITLGLPWPQPASDHFRLPVTVAHGGPLRVSINDVLGHRSVVLYDGEANAGDNLLSLRLPSLPGGTYILHAAGDCGASSRLLLIR